MSIKAALNKIRMMPKIEKSYEYPIKPPELMPGVVPANETAPVMALDSNPYSYAAQVLSGGGFPGYQYLAQLATRAEYRAFASAMSTELTREFIKFTSQQDDDISAADKIKAIEAEFKRLDVRGVIQKASEHDCYFGRGQIFIDIDRAEKAKPLILDPRTVKVGSLRGVVPVEAVWTTPSAYNALDPTAPDFYRPSRWWMLGSDVHASRMMTIVTRQLPDILKPAFNFSGLSLSQLAEPVVDNWLRTRQSVADLINNFSITALATAMDQVLQGDDDGSDLFNRADLFTATRSNKGLMILDKDREELVQVNTPLSGLHELQAQAQELMCSISRLPAIILTGISPSGLNASSDGEIRVFYDWIAAQQESFWRTPIETILKVVQLSLFGEIDPDIGFEFVPLYQMTPAEEAEIRAKDAATDVSYVGSGILDPSEVRERIAKSPTSGYQGLDTSIEIVPPMNDIEDDGPMDDESEEENESPFAQDKDETKKENWVTLPNGEHVMIDESGDVVAGAGGSLSKGNSESKQPEKQDQTREHHKSSKGVHTDKGLHDDQRKAINAYIGEHYRPINRALRFSEHFDKMDDATAERIKHIRNAFKEIPPTEADITVVRTTGKTSIDNMLKSAGSAGLKKGAILKEDGIMSTAHSDGVFPGAIGFEIKIPKGSKAIDLSETQNREEQEVILPPGTKLKVTSAKKDHKGYNMYIICEVVK